jgi:hypothetical protein
MTTAAGRPPVVKDDPAAGRQEKELSPEEEQEAREVAERFAKGFKETKDIGSLIDDMFVGDYAERLRLQNLRDPLVRAHGGVPLDASPAKLRSFVVAVLNFWSLMIELQEAGKRAQKPDDRETGESPGPEEMFPAGVLKFIKSERRLARFVSNLIGEKIAFDEVTGDTDEDAGGAEDEDDFFFKDAQELRDLTDALEKIGSMIREHLLKLPAANKASEDDSESEDDATDVRLTILGEGDDFYGYPSGSRLICVNVSVFHLDLVRIGGRLKILAVTPLTDSD